MEGAAMLVGCSKTPRMIRQIGHPDKGRQPGRMVAPICNPEGRQASIGKKASIGPPDDALAVECSQRTNRDGGAKRYREMKTKAKVCRSRFSQPAVHLSARN